MPIYQTVTSRQGLVHALRMATYEEENVLCITCGTFTIHLDAPIPSTHPWSQCVMCARERSIKALIRRIKKQPKSLFKVEA